MTSSGSCLRLECRQRSSNAPLAKNAMKTKQRKGAAGKAFWDTSAIVPLCCFQRQSAHARQMVRLYDQQVVWWTTPVEAVSSLTRLGRNGQLTTQEIGQAFARLDYMRTRWHEIQPAEQVRSQAERLLKVHRLRAGDAFQLAAALLWCNYEPRKRPFICADDVLSNAAAAEGFLVVKV